MKVFKIISILMVFLMSLCSCSRDGDVSDDTVTSEELMSGKVNVSQSKSNNDVTFSYQGCNYLLLGDDSLAYINKKNIYIGDIVVENLDAIVNDRSSESGEIEVKNPLTGEYFIIKNIREQKGITYFDVDTSIGDVFYDIKLFSGQQTTSKAMPIVPIIRGVVAIVSIIAVASTSGGTQSDCISSMPTNCPEGYTPYAHYESGWFTSTCDVGCRK